MSPLAHSFVRPFSGFPRVSGDEPTEDVEALGYAEFSPRERG